MKKRKFIALIGISQLALSSRPFHCFDGDTEGGGGGGAAEAQISAEDQAKIDSELSEVSKGFGDIIKKNLPSSFALSKNAPGADTENAASDLAAIMADEELRPLVEFKKNGGKIADLIKSSNGGVDYDTVSPDILFGQIIEKYPDADKIAEKKRWEGLTQFQKDNEVRSYRSELKAKAPVGNADFSKVINEFNSKAAPIRQRETESVKGYLTSLAQNVKTLKDPETGKEYDDTQQEAIFQEAKTLSALRWKKVGNGEVKGTSADDLTLAIKKAEMLVNSDKIIEHTAASFLALGYKQALEKRYRPTADLGGGRTAAQRGAGGEKGPVVAKGQTKIVHPKVGTLKGNQVGKT